MTMALQALSLVEKAEPVQVRFTPRLRDQRSVCVCARARARWMYGLHGFVHGTEWIMFHGHLDYFQNPSLGGRPDTKLGDHGIPNAHNHRFVLF